jgi:YHS domain-containing protein
MEAASLVTWTGVGVAIVAVLMWAARRYAAKHPLEEPMIVTDPVCRMTFDVAQAVAKVEYAGKTYHFCSEACHKRFAAEPGKYAGVAGQESSGHHH